MGRFLAHQKKHQENWRRKTAFLSELAKSDAGHYSGNRNAGTGDDPYPFCLPLGRATENLMPAIREPAIGYFGDPPGPFGDGAIPWHAGRGGTPSTHLCDSQVCCVNFLFPLRDNVEGATALLRRVYPYCEKVVPVQAGEAGLVEFEWLGDPRTECLNEGGRRTRGANATSFDAAMSYEDCRGDRHLVLIEWKYTESYPPSERTEAGKFDGDNSGRTRRDRYRDILGDPAGNIDMRLVALEDLGYEPFYQFARQQMLADALAGGFAGVHVLHISPDANKDFRLVTPERLRSRFTGLCATEVWTKLLKDPAQFTAAYTEDLFGPLVSAPPAGLEAWAEYILERYGPIVQR